MYTGAVYSIRTRVTNESQLLRRIHDDNAINLITPGLGRRWSRQRGTPDTWQSRSRHNRRAASRLKIRRDSPRWAPRRRASPQVGTEMRRDWPRFAEMHRDAPRCAEMHRDAPRCAEMRRDAPRRRTCAQRGPSTRRALHVARSRSRVRRRGRWGGAPLAHYWLTPRHRHRQLPPPHTHTRRGEGMSERSDACTAANAAAMSAAKQVPFCSFALPSRCFRCFISGLLFVPLLTLCNSAGARDDDADAAQRTD